MLCTATLVNRMGVTANRLHIYGAARAQAGVNAAGAELAPPAESTDTVTSPAGEARLPPYFRQIGTAREPCCRVRQGVQVSIRLEAPASE